MADADTKDEGQGGAETSGEQETFSADEVKTLREKSKAAEKAAKEAQRQLQETLKRFEGIDVEEVRALRQKAEEAEKKAAERDPAKAEELFERKRAKLAEEYEQKLKSLGDENSSLKGKVKSFAVTDRVMGEIGKLFNDDAHRFIKREVEERCDLDEDGGIVVKDEHGEVLYKGARPMTPKEFGELLAEQYPSLAKPAGSGGAKDTAAGHKAPSRGARDYSKITYEEFASLPNQQEVWKKYLTSEQRIEFASRMRIGGQH